MWRQEPHSTHRAAAGATAADHDALRLYLRDGSDNIDAHCRRDGHDSRRAERRQFATTDATGAFQFAALQTGSFTVQAKATGYVERVQSVTLTGALALTMELDPEFQMVTVTKEESLLGSEAGCGGWDYVSAPGPCTVNHLFNVHHDGPLTVEVAWLDRDTAPSIELYRASNGVRTGVAIPLGRGTAVDAHTQYLIQVRKLALIGDSPPVGTTKFTLTVTRPN